MNFRWLFGNFADPDFRLTRKQQYEVTRLAHRKYLSSMKLAVVTIVLVATSWLFLGFAWNPLAAVFVAWRIPWPRWSSIIVICIAAIVFAAWIYRYIYVRPVRRAMRELGYDVCVNCGYRLQGLPETTTQCPECGSTREGIPITSEAVP